MYRASDAYVIPTRGEGWGMPITEVCGEGRGGPGAYGPRMNQYRLVCAVGCMCNCVGYGMTDGGTRLNGLKAILR